MQYEVLALEMCAVHECVMDQNVCGKLCGSRHTMIARQKLKTSNRFALVNDSHYFTFHVSF